MKPRDPTEMKLVERCARSQWMCERAGRAQDVWLGGLVKNAPEREAVRVRKLKTALFHDPRGPHALYGLSSAADGGERTSWPEKPEDREKYDPFVILKELEAIPQGCEALLGCWGMLRSRIVEERGWQSIDRLKAIRMLGMSPIDICEDERISQIYLGSFAVFPFGRKNAYQDLKADTTALE